MKTILRFKIVPLLIISLACSVSEPLFAAEETLQDKTKATVKDASAAVEDATKSASESLKNLWHRIDEARLKNRTPDQLVAWALMGVLVGGVAGAMTTFKPTGLGKVGRLLLGLAGACLGGIVVHVANLNFGWGPVLIRYEELLFSLLGALLLIVLGKAIASAAKRKESKQ
jgi:uncharacterized membrane protein YeaQ/YmgE (transglycosylase-associated protein family)